MKELRLTSNHRRRAAQQRKQGDVGRGDQKTKKGCLRGTCSCTPTLVSGGSKSTSSQPQMQGLVNCRVQAPAVQLLLMPTELEQSAACEAGSLEPLDVEVGSGGCGREAAHAVCRVQRLHWQGEVALTTHHACVEGVLPFLLWVASTQPRSCMVHSLNECCLFCVHPRPLCAVGCGKLPVHCRCVSFFLCERRRWVTDSGVLMVSTHPTTST